MTDQQLVNDCPRRALCRVMVCSAPRAEREPRGLVVDDKYVTFGSFFFQITAVQYVHTHISLSFAALRRRQKYSTKEQENKK